MTSALIKPGTFVQYTHLGESGIGKVEDGGENPLVTFWDSGKFGKVERKKASDLAPLVDAWPVALLWDHPEELAPWAKEKPLRLVALALSIGNGKGKPADVKEKLDSRVPLGTDWKTWWNKRTKSMNELAKLPEPEHFTKSAKGNEYALLCGVEDVPDGVQSPVSQADWQQWLLHDVNLPTFGKNPSKVLCDSLAEWPEDTIEGVLKRVLWGADLLLGSSKKPSAAAALSWMDAVGSTAIRWAALHPDGVEMTERSGEVLARLSQYIQVKEKRKEATLFRAGVLSEGPDRQRQLEQQRREQERQQADYEKRLERQRQEQERQQADYEKRLERQRQEQEHQRASYAAEAEELRQSHTAELQRERREQERLRDKVETLRNQLFSGYEQSKLDIRQDMLVIVGELSQLVAKQDCFSDDLLRDVRVGLALALQAGGAKPLGDAGDTVAFDPSHHHAFESLRIGDSVRISAPGFIVKGQRTSDRVLVKALVFRISEKG